MVRFLPRTSESVGEVHSVFQFLNGKVLTRIYRVSENFVVVFQSLNGKVLTLGASSEMEQKLMFQFLNGKVLTTT